MALKQSIDGKEGVITPITNWGDHYKSWTKHNDNLLLIKYENLPFILAKHGKLALESS